MNAFWRNRWAEITLGLALIVADAAVARSPAGISYLLCLAASYLPPFK